MFGELRASPQAQGITPSDHPFIPRAGIKQTNHGPKWVPRGATKKELLYSPTVAERLHEKTLWPNAGIASDDLSPSQI